MDEHRPGHNAERRGAQVFLWLAFFGLPLVLHRGYFNVTETKTVFFTVTALSFLCFRGVMALQFPRKAEKLTASECFALALAATALLSSVLSGRFRASFLGAEGRFQGAGMMTLYALLFLALRRSPWREKDVRAPLLAGLALTAALAVVNHAGLDVLGIAARLGERDRGRYISTLGNINFAGAYFTLTLGAAITWLLLSERIGERLLLAGVSALGLWGVMAAWSESSLLGLFALSALLPLLLRCHPRALRRWPWLAPGMAAAAQLYALLCGRTGAYLSALTRLLLRWELSAPLALLGLLLGLYLRKKEDKTLRRFIRIYGWMLAAALALCEAALVLVNTAWRELPLGGWETWLRFSPGWGTDRGAIWARCLAYYRGFPLPEKLLGGGCGVLARLDRNNRLFPDAVLDTAHSEYLQLLLNWGALGLAAWLGWLFFAGRAALRQNRPLSAALLSGAAAYAAQASVNIAQAPSICLFVVMASLCAAEPEP